MTTEPRVLVIEDELSIRTNVVAGLADAGFTARGLPEGSRLEAELLSFRPDAVILDWMLPGRDGSQLAAVVRERSDAAIILLTARTRLDDRLTGFLVGADDYLAKPFAMAELLARLRAVLRRRGKIATTMQIGDLVVDEAAAIVSRGGQVIDLTATETRLLIYLAHNRERIVSPTQILTQVWGYDDYADNLVQVHISALRRKLESYGPRMIDTRRGLGYILRAPSR